MEGNCEQTTGSTVKYGGIIVMTLKKRVKLRDGKKVGITEKTVRKGYKMGRTVNNCGYTASNMQASSTTRSTMKKGFTTGKTA